MDVAREALIADLVKEAGVNDSQVRRVLNALSVRMNERLQTGDAFDMPGVGLLAKAETGLMGMQGRSGWAYPQQDLIVSSTMSTTPNRGSLGGVLGVVEPSKRLELGDLIKDLKKE